MRAESTMHLIISPKLATTADARPDVGSPVAAQKQGSSPGDCGNRETWRRILAAYIQPLPDSAD
jgi:hypothetical protein